MKHTTICGCPNGKIKTQCVSYDDVMLMPLGVIRGDNLTTIINKISEMFSDVLLKVDNSTSSSNIGSGVNVLKGKNNSGVTEFRTLNKGVGILLTQTSDGIRVEVDSAWLLNYFKEYVNEQWFEQHFKDLIKQPWFVDYLQSLFIEPWFKDILSYWSQQEWFANQVFSVMKQPLFINNLSALLSQDWFERVLKQTMQNQWFVEHMVNMSKQSWFAEAVKRVK